MCSRFELKGDSAAVGAALALRRPPPWPDADTFRPTDRALVIGRTQGRLLSWGLPVDWDARPVINARMETVPDKPLFRRLLGKRVLVPATAWWEWDAARRKMRLARADGALMTFAGLYDGDSFVILTRPALAGIRAVHERMPLLVDGRWLEGGPPQPVEPDIAAVPDLQAPPPQSELFS